MKSISFAAAAFAALLLVSTASAQTKRPLIDPAVAEKATLVQQEAFAGCMEAALKECPKPMCKADTTENVRKCHEEQGRCQVAKTRECARYLGQAEH